MGPASPSLAGVSAAEYSNCNVHRRHHQLGEGLPTRRRAWWDVQSWKELVVARPLVGGIRFLPVGEQARTRQIDATGRGLAGIVRRPLIGP